NDPKSFTPQALPPLIQDRIVFRYAGKDELQDSILRNVLQPLWRESRDAATPPVVPGAREEAYLHFQPEYAQQKEVLERLLRERYNIFPLDASVPGDDARARRVAQIIKARYCFIDVSNAGRPEAEAECHIILGIADAIARLKGGARNVMLFHKHGTPVPSL